MEEGVGKKQIPFGNDRKKSKGKCRSRSFATLRMTNQKQTAGLSAAARERAFGRDDKFEVVQNADSLRE
jgi:hypothetical protein